MEQIREGVKIPAGDIGVELIDAGDIARVDADGLARQFDAARQRRKRLWQSAAPNEVDKFCAARVGFAVSKTQERLERFRNDVERLLGGGVDRDLGGEHRR